MLTLLPLCRRLRLQIVQWVQKLPRGFGTLIDLELFSDIHAVAPGIELNPDAPRNRACRLCAAEIFLWGLKEWWLREREKGGPDAPNNTRRDCPDAATCTRYRDDTGTCCATLPLVSVPACLFSYYLFLIVWTTTAHARECEPSCLCPLHYLLTGWLYVCTVNHLFYTRAFSDDGDEPSEPPEQAPAPPRAAPLVPTRPATPIPAALTFFDPPVPSAHIPIASSSSATSISFLLNPDQDMGPVSPPEFRSPTPDTRRAAHTGNGMDEGGAALLG